MRWGCESDWEIRVDAICDESWANCKTVSELSAQNSGNTITISPTSTNSGQYCYSTDWKTLVCNNTLTWAIINMFSDENTYNTYFSWLFKRIIIRNFTWTLMTGTNGMICVKDGDKINCNTNPSTLSCWTPIDIQWEDGQRCTYVCDKYDEQEGKKCLEWHIECYQSAPSCDWECTGWSGVTVSWVTLWWYCRYITQELLDRFDDDKATLFDLWSMTTENGWIQCTFTGWSSSPTQSITINWNDTSLCCRYTSPTAITCDQNCGGGWNEYYYTITGWTTNIYSWQITIISWWSTTIDWLRNTWKDSLWASMLTPTKGTNRIFLANPTTNNPAVIRHGNKLLILKSWLDLASSPVEFNAKWAKFGNVSIDRNFRTYDNSAAWVSIAWQLILGNIYSDNYLYLYASGNAGSSNAHYEISANKELSVWINSGAFLYFQSYTGNNSSNYYRN